MNPPDHIRTPTGHLMVLREGADVFAALAQLAVQEALPSASFTGLGFVHATFGFWNRETRQFDPRTFRDVELGSMVGSIAWQEGKPSIHAHGVAAGSDFQAVGGHLLELQVSTGSVEITLVVNDRQLERALDACLGANVLRL